LNRESIRLSPQSALLSLARKIAESIIGVRSVIDDIRVNLSVRDNDARARDIRMNLQQVQLRQGAEISVAVDNGVATLSGIVDSWILSRMATRKARSVIGVTEVVNRIEVTVKDGRVILSGTAPTVAQKRRAKADAWIAGVVDVRSQNLEVKWSAKGARMRPAPYIPKSDQKILMAVKDALHMDPRVNPEIPDVVVFNGSVTLSGPVETLYAKRAAVEDARNTTGVWQVDNQLRLRYRAFPPDAEVKRLIEDVFRRDAELHDQNIAVDVEDNHVTLSGSAKTVGQKVRAENIVSQIDGVLTVENHIKVAARGHQVSDAQITAAIIDELYWSPYVDSDRLTVTVKNGRATLKGRAADRFVASIAVQNAFEGGARSVRTNLTLNDGSVLANIYEAKPELSWPSAAW
jgi:osmotically-inducible protein OsmY